MSLQLLIEKAFFKSPDQEQKGININDILFAILLALVSTVLSYKFAVGNQLEQLPIIIRQLDSSYLINDFFLSTTEAFGPRTYFIVFLGFLCQFFPIPWVYVVLTFLSDLALVAVTLWAARTVIGSSRLGASFSAVMVLGLACFHLGDATQIRYEVFQPASLAIPGALGAIVMGFKGRPVSAAIIASVASLPHPLYGAEGGGIALGMAFLVLLLPHSSKHTLYSLLNNLNWVKAFKHTLPGAIILGGCLVIFWGLPYQEVTAGVHLSTDEFYNILARFRAPHHYLPSHFRINDFITLFFFVIAIIFAFNQWVKSVSCQTSIVFLFPIVVVFCCCLIAYFCSEIWPVRIVLTLQLFRLLFIIKWLGFLLFGAVFSGYLIRPNNAATLPLSLVSLMSTGITQPILTSLSLTVIRFPPWNWLKINPKIYLFPIIIFALFLWFLFGNFSEIVFLFFAYILILVFMQNKIITGTRILATGLVAILVLVLIQYRGTDQYSKLVPIIDSSDQHSVNSNIAHAITNVTPEDALLITPPEFGILRIIGGRALVVDFKSIPFQDHAMKKWYQRIKDVYGDVSGGGFKAVKELDEAYKNISDEKLLSLAQYYKATHALLYIETQTLLPKLYVNDTYQVVQLSTE